MNILRFRACSKAGGNGSGNSHERHGKHRFADGMDSPGEEL